MGNDPIKISGNTNVTVRNFKPIEGRTAKKTDCIWTNDKKGQLELPKEYQEIFGALKDLDNDKTSLSWDDAAKAKALEGQYGIQKVGLDGNNKVVSFTLDDGTYLNVDMGLNEEPGVKALQKYINKGEASFKKHNILNLLTGELSGSAKEDQIYVTIPNGTKMKEIKTMFNLPDGALYDYVSFFRHATGDRDEFKVDGNQVWFSADKFAEGNGLTKEQVRNLFE